MLVIAAATSARATEPTSDACAARAATDVVLREQGERIHTLELNLAQALELANRANTNVADADRTSRAFRLAAYTAGFTIGAVGGGLTSSEMTTKPGLVAAGTAIGAVIGTAFVLIVDQVFLN
jgi:hypothetical protein